MKEGAGDPGGTLQGRPTCKKPAAQTFPPLLKGCIVSRFPGGFLLSNDLSQIELRVPTLLSGDEALVRNYQLGLDLHTDRARSIFDTNEVDKLQRQVGKTINFADLYLAMAKTMRATVLQMTGLNMPLSFFQRIVDARYSERTGLTLWQVEQCRTAARQGYIELPFTGQSRMFDGFVFDEKEWGKNHRIQQVKRHPEDPDVVHEIVNFPIQTIAGNLMLQIQREVSDLLGLYKSPHPDIRMFLNIYDAVWFDCRRQKDVDLAQQAFDHVVNNCRYWQMLQDLYGREVPLAYESSVAA
jgi:DNA polymerase I-like protein with 3'-5' exonuclease and polymerase domains